MLLVEFVAILNADRELYCCSAVHNTPNSCSFLALQQTIMYKRFYCPRGSDGLYCFRMSFFSVRTITHKPLRLTR